jgi:hypothetical protein
VSKSKFAGILLGAGVVVGGAVAALASLTGTTQCVGIDAEQDCYDLVRTLSLRAGLIAGLMTVVMILLVAGLLRMLSQEDRQRAERAMEAYRARGGDPWESPSSG